MKRSRTELADDGEEAPGRRTVAVLGLVGVLAACALGLAALWRWRPLLSSAPGNALAATSQPTATAAPTSAALSDMNVVLLGIDRRPDGDASWRTDTIIIVAVRPQAGLVGLFSIPRDLWVEIPGQETNRINTVDYLGEQAYGSGGGPRLLQETLQQHLNISLQGYMRVDFVGLKRVIDSLGGITVNPDRSYDDMIDDGTCPPWHMHIDPGPQHMDGCTALGYIRTRAQYDDLDRCRREQQVLLAIREAALRPTMLPQLPRLLTSLAGAVDTDLSPSQLTSLLALAGRLGPAAYRTRVIDRTMVRDWTTPGGAMVLVPDWVGIRQAWDEFLVSPS